MTNRSTAKAVDQLLPWPKMATFGLQHVLIMYAGCVAVPLAFGAALGLDQHTVAMLINADLLVAGIITIIQSLGVGKIFGVRLPVIAGATFVQLTPLILIGQEYGMQAVYGSMLAGGVFGLIMAWPFAKVIKYFPPLVTGSVLVVIGISLISVAGGSIVGQDPTSSEYGDLRNLALAGIVMVIAIGFICVAKGFWSQAGILVALVGGLLVAIPLGLLDFGAMAGEDWFGVVTPFHFGPPQFPIAGVISCSIVMMVIFAESLSSMMALAEITGKKVTRGDIARGLAADGLSGVLGGIMNGFADTVFNQNVGAVRTTRIYSRYVTAVAGLILVILSLIPKMGAAVAALPPPIIGGVSLVLFATIAVVGVQALRRANLHDNVNATIVALAVGLGLLPKFMPDMFQNFPSWSLTIVSDGVVLTAVSAFLLNLLFNHTGFARRSDRAPEVTAAYEAGEANPYETDDELAIDADRADDVAADVSAEVTTGGRGDGRTDIPTP
ncbi:purine permease [Rhodococcus rhodnii]|uniref:Purine permease n=2 Tax=Rhodococcus rhodnii TaxID=38312 RepID=A0A6P2C8C7_9NOCA|nr:nucleobase:cation symporter-2 family protein [Rhodococcus rhodnii]EOM77808.1 putative permease [Rhodococcus rhodnii LMG 5362]TXG88997.1 purine permease [Rhodococcus rhodnii]